MDILFKKLQTTGSGIGRSTTGDRAGSAQHHKAAASSKETLQTHAGTAPEAAAQTPTAAFP